MCFLALMLLRSLEKKLDIMGRHMSSSRISEVLQSATLIPIPDSLVGIQLWNASNCDNIYNTQRAGKGKLKKDDNELDDIDSIVDTYSSERSIEPDDLDAITKAVGLQPLQVRSSVGQAKERLGMRSMRKDVMIAKSVLARLGLIERNLTSTPRSSEDCK